MGAPTDFDESPLLNEEAAFPSASASFRDVSEDGDATAASDFEAVPSPTGAFCGAWSFISPGGMDAGDITAMGATSASDFRCSWIAELVEGFVSIVLVPRKPSRAGSLVSAVAFKGDGTGVDVDLVPCPPGAIPLLAFGFEVSADEASMTLPPPNGVDSNGATTWGVAVRAGSFVSFGVAFDGCGATEMGGGPTVVGGTAKARSVEAAATGSALPARADHAVPCSPGVAIVAISLVALGFRISADAAWIGWLPPDGVDQTAVVTSGRVVRAGPFVSFSVAFDGCGRTETGGDPAGPGGSTDATSVDDVITGFRSSTGVEWEMVSATLLTADAGTSGERAGNEELSKIFPLVSGTMLAAGSCVSGGVEVCTEELEDFAALFTPPFAAIFPVAPMAFGFTVVSPIPFVASAKAVENFPDVATLPTDALAGVTFTATAGRLTITGSP